jgi:hypothetical protein
MRRLATAPRSYQEDRPSISSLPVSHLVRPSHRGWRSVDSPRGAATHQDLAPTRVRPALMSTKTGELEGLDAERDRDDEDAVENARDHVGHEQPYSCEDEPYDVSDELHATYPLPSSLPIRVDQSSHRTMTAWPPRVKPGRRCPRLMKQLTRIVRRAVAQQPQVMTPRTAEP